MEFDSDYTMFPDRGFDSFADNLSTAFPFGSWNDSLDAGFGDSSDGMLDDGSDPAYENFLVSSRFWTKRVLFPLVLCVGAVGNGVTIVILTRRRMRSSTNHYLTALAFSDLFYLIFSFTLNLNYYQAMDTFAYYGYWRYALMLTDACSNTSVWLTVTFTVERYIAVCHPIRGKVFCTRARAKRVIWVVVFACFLVAVPTPFEWSAEEITLPNNSTRVQPVPSALGEDETYKACYYWFTSITFVFLPLILLAIFNTFLIRSVHQSKTQRRRMTMRGHRNDHARQENRITVMLIAVVIMFMLCQLPTATILVYNAVYSGHKQSDEETSVLRGLGNIFNCMVAVNAACNFVLYCAFSDRYRRTFLRTFVPCLFRRGSPNHSQTNAAANNSTYTHIEVDSVGGSFRHRRSTASLRSTPRGRGAGSGGGGAISANNANRKSATSLMKAVAGSAASVVASRKLSAASGAAAAAGGATTNGGAKCQLPHKRYFLHVPLGSAESNGGTGTGANGQCAQEDSVGSDGTQETTFYSSNNDVRLCSSTPGGPMTAPDVSETPESDSTSQNSTLTVEADDQQEMHVISLTTPDGTDKLL